MRIHLSADDLRLDVARAQAGKLSTTVAGARNGSVLIEVTKAELQGLLMAYAQAALDKIGATIQSADLTLSSDGGPAVEANLRAIVKKLVCGTVIVDARVDVNNDLSVTVSELRAVSEGVVGSLVFAFFGLNSKIRDYEGQYKLAPQLLKNVQMSGLCVTIDDSVRITAELGT